MQRTSRHSNPTDIPRNSKVSQECRHHHWKRNETSQGLHSRRDYDATPSGSGAGWSAEEEWRTVNDASPDRCPLELDYTQALLLMARSLSSVMTAFNAENAHT